MKTIALIGLLFCLFLQRNLSAAGTTVLTHGLKGNTDGWVSSMAERITQYPRFPSGGSTTYQLFYTNVGNMFYIDWKRTSGLAPTNTGSGEILIALDWRDLAAASLFLGSSTWNTSQVAPPVAYALTATNFISELNGHALAEFPIHLVGHSRGGSLMCEVSRLLGNQGIWVDHVTTLDPHPLNDPEFPSDFLLYPQIVDAPANSYENVLFHDNYYQLIGIAQGKTVSGAYNRRLLNLTGGYEGAFDDSESHGDVHLWYHGTLDFRFPASDTEATLGSYELLNWYSASEELGAKAGYYYSRLGRGDRSSADRPAGLSTAQIREGLNQLWDFGAGQNYNRTALTANSGTWPNVVKLNLTTTNLVAYGQSVSLKIFYHWATNIVRSGTIGFYSDDDLNPLNSNSRLIREFSFNSQGPNNMGISTASLTIDSTNSPAGFHAVYAKITGGGRSRYLYAPEILNVVSSFAQPTLDVVRSGNQVTVGVNGVAGQIVILDSASSIGSWSPMVTNRLSTNRWTVPYTIPTGSGSQFFRARLGP